MWVYGLGCYETAFRRCRRDGHRQPQTHFYTAGTRSSSVCPRNDNGLVPEKMPLKVPVN
jgi:hypothetical protein